ncbi:DUF2635 domain-containing protein [Pasteurellaceae bacterium 15-036681]|nr:DUF2635 domain-containing protein [Pasteurellaceae bacterium 15-036681]
MKVKAAKGVRVPCEEQPYNYITDDVAVEVVDSLYYQRRIVDGDLVIVEEQAVEFAEKSAKGGK